MTTEVKNWKNWTNGGVVHQQSIKPLLNLKKMGQQFAATFISNVYINTHYE